MQKTFVLGIAGQIASGKSARCQHLFTLAKSRASAVPKFIDPHVINADKVAHEIYAPGTAAYLKIIEKFGESVLKRPSGGSGDSNDLLLPVLPMPLKDLLEMARRNHGSLENCEEADELDLPEIDRKVLGKIVFAEPSKLQLLNTIVWPSMDERLLQTIEEKTSKSALLGNRIALIILEAAVMIESGFFKHCDDIWLFSCDPAVAIQRLKERDGLSEEAARARLGAQRSVAERLEFLQGSGFSGGTRVFDTTHCNDLEQGLKEVTKAFGEWWEERARPLIERK